MQRSRRTALWVGINVAGVVAYLYFASWVWPPARLRGLPEGHAAGDPVIWGLTAFPTFLASALLDLGVVVWAALDRARHGSWRFAWWAWSIPVLWMLAYAIDAYHE